MELDGNPCIRITDILGLAVTGVKEGRREHNTNFTGIIRVSFLLFVAWALEGKKD